MLKRKRTLKLESDEIERLKKEVLRLTDRRTEDYTARILTTADLIQRNRQMGLLNKAHEKVLRRWRFTLPLLQVVFGKVEDETAWANRVVEEARKLRLKRELQRLEAQARKEGKSGETDQGQG